MKFGIGQPVPRTEDPALPQDKGRYVADIMRQTSHTAYVLRSPHAHATIRSIEQPAAKAAPGVLADCSRGADARAEKHWRPALQRASVAFGGRQGLHGAASGAAA